MIFAPALLHVVLYEADVRLRRQLLTHVLHTLFDNCKRCHETCQHCMNHKSRELSMSYGHSSYWGLNDARELVIVNSANIPTSSTCIHTKRVKVLSDLGKRQDTRETPFFYGPNVRCLPIKHYLSTREECKFVWCNHHCGSHYQSPATNLYGHNMLLPVPFSQFEPLRIHPRKSRILDIFISIMKCYHTLCDKTAYDYHRDEE